MAGGRMVTRLLWSLAVAAALASGGMFLASRSGLLMGLADAAADQSVYVELVAPGLDTTVYRMAPGSRVRDLFLAARVPLPRSLDGGRSIDSGRAFHVEKGGVSETWMSGDRLVALGVPIALNECSVEDLVAVPGIGTATAIKIVQARVSRGGFGSYGEVAEVSGIGQKTLQTLEKHTRL